LLSRERQGNDDTLAGSSVSSNLSGFWLREFRSIEQIRLIRQVGKRTDKHPILETPDETQRGRTLV